MKIGLLIICFNRPSQTRRVLNSILQSNFDLSSIQIFISLDGPRNNSEAVKTDLVYREAKYFSEGMTNVKVIRHNINLGLKKHVLSAISNAFDIADALIILEDDICMNTECLYKTVNLLNTHVQSKEIGHINLFNEGLSSPILNSFNFKNSEFYLDQVFTCWGWATWKDRWREPFVDRNSLMKLNCIERLKFNHYGRSNHLAHLYSNILGEASTWAILRKFDLFTNKRLKSLTSRNSLVTNIGLDGSGTHKLNKTKRHFIHTKLIIFVKSYVLILLPVKLGIYLINITQKSRVGKY